MYNIAKLTNKQRETIFNRYVLDFGGNIDIIEKDYWVTLMLDYLFHKSVFKDYLIFKGGTSLSKCFNIIDRFSEDIDLILRWDILTNDNPDDERTKTQQEKYNHKINDLAESFIKEKVLPALTTDFEHILLTKPIFKIEEGNPCVINFSYPRISDINKSNILKNIRLEIGPLAALSPTEEVAISPLIARMGLPLMDNTSTIIKTVSPERTFWEKVLILHQEAHRPIDKDVPLRYSRHYYDVYKISQTIYKEKAYSNLQLLKMVRDFKTKFYPSSWASYQTAKPGSFNLIPSEKHLSQLSNDFNNMKEMINDSSLSNFEELLTKLKDIEKDLNNLV
ncbi:MAG: nucleotidyl transferase AbiEii/AbiGii toxin family protein [Clostridia bacterium]|nr:nucleotidyl transferase AbiEii/AbiGii toxin family protein [Clostridia bacterium]